VGAPDQPFNFIVLVLHMLNLAPLVSDQSNDHGVEVEEEHKQVETKLDERLLLVHVKLPEDLRSVEQVLVLEDPVGNIVSMLSSK
jgi:gamma-glutamyl phosphate reductase